MTNSSEPVVPHHIIEGIEAEVRAAGEAMQRVKVIHRSRQGLEAERDALRSALTDCYSPECPCHMHQWQELSSVLFLLEGTT